jgi:hypothetical protein
VTLVPPPKHPLPNPLCAKWGWVCCNGHFAATTLTGHYDAWSVGCWTRGLFVKSRKRYLTI